MKYLAIVLIAWPAAAVAHPGGLDATGGHYDTETGAYHCHRESCFSQVGSGSRAAPQGAPRAESAPASARTLETAPRAGGPATPDDLICPKGARLVWTGAEWACARMITPATVVDEPAAATVTLERPSGPAERQAPEEVSSRTDAFVPEGVSRETSEASADPAYRAWFLELHGGGALPLGKLELAWDPGLGGGLALGFMHEKGGSAALDVYYGALEPNPLAEAFGGSTMSLFSYAVSGGYNLLALGSEVVSLAPFAGVGVQHLYDASGAEVRGDAWLAVSGSLRLGLQLGPAFELVGRWGVIYALTKLTDHAPGPETFTLMPLQAGFAVRF